MKLTLSWRPRNAASHQRAVSRLARLLMVALGAATISITSYAAQATVDHVFWSGQSQDFKIRWSSSDLLVQRGPLPVFSAREFAKQGLAHFVSVNKDPATAHVPACAYERRFRLLAVVGTFLSFSDQYEASCEREAHPGGETRFTTIDLANPRAIAYTGSDAFGEVAPGGKAVRLTDIFSEQETFNALRTDPIIIRLLQDHEGPAPGNLSELMKSIAGKFASTPDCFSIPGDLLTRFAFRHIAAGEVTVELGLPGAGPCRDNLTPLLLRFATPARLKPKAGQSISVEAPFVKDQDWNEGTGETVVHLQTGRVARHVSH